MLAKNIQYNPHQKKYTLYLQLLSINQSIRVHYPNYMNYDENICFIKILSKLQDINLQNELLENEISSKTKILNYLIMKMNLENSIKDKRD